MFSTTTYLCKWLLHKMAIAPNTFDVCYEQASLKVPKSANSGWLTKLLSITTSSKPKMQLTSASSRSSFFIFYSRKFEKGDICHLKYFPIQVYNFPSCSRVSQNFKKSTPTFLPKSSESSSRIRALVPFILCQPSRDRL